MPRLKHESYVRHGRTISIELDGESFDAIAGESIASALTAFGRLELGRDKSGASRGLFCGMGACFDCQVSVDGGPPVRACLTKARHGMKIRSLAYRAAVPVAEPQSARESSERLSPDVLIVGAGPAGMSAALELAEAGATVIVADGKTGTGRPVLQATRAFSRLRSQETPGQSVSRRGGAHRTADEQRRTSDRQRECMGRVSGTRRAILKSAWPPERKRTPFIHGNLFLPPARSNPLPRFQAGRCLES